MNHTFRFETPPGTVPNSPIPMSHSNTTDSDTHTNYTPQSRTMSPRSRKRSSPTGVVTVTSNIGVVYTSLSSDDNCNTNAKLHSECPSNPHRTMNVAIPSSLTNLREHLSSSKATSLSSSDCNSSSSSSSANERDTAAPMFPLHTLQDTLQDESRNPNCNSPMQMQLQLQSPTTGTMRRIRKTGSRSPTRCNSNSGSANNSRQQQQRRQHNRPHMHTTHTRIPRISQPPWYQEPPTHRPYKQQRSISPVPRTKQQPHQTQTQLPYLWTEGFARDVTESIKGPVDRTIHEGRLHRSPMNECWSNLVPQDILRSGTAEGDNINSAMNGEEDDVLGAGSFSSVTRVRIRGKGSASYFALKHLKQDLLPSRLTEHSSKNGSITAFTKAATELAREAFLLSHFDHPNVIRIIGWTDGGVKSYSTFRRHDAYFLVLELLQEETLDDRIERWNHDDAQIRAALNLTPDEHKEHSYKRKIEQLSICKQVAAALSYIHSKNVVYRDLKPQNIGFARNNSNNSNNSSNNDQQSESESDSDNLVVKLMDFGLARELPSSGRLYTPYPSVHHIEEKKDADSAGAQNVMFDMTGTVGTIRYMAPEVCLNRSYGLECDIYSWSIVAHEVLSQEKPYDDMTPHLYQDLVCKQGIRPQCRDMPSEYTVLLTQAWRTDPSKRLALDRIQRQLDLFLQQEKLLWLNQQLLSGMPESNDSSVSLPYSYSDDNMSAMNSMNSLGSMHGRHGQPRGRAVKRNSLTILPGHAQPKTLERERERDRERAATKRSWEHSNHNAIFPNASMNTSRHGAIPSFDPRAVRHNQSPPSHHQNNYPPFYSRPEHPRDHHPHQQQQHPHHHPHQLSPPPPYGQPSHSISPPRLREEMTPERYSMHQQFYHRQNQKAVAAPPFPSPWFTTTSDHQNNNNHPGRFEMRPRYPPQRGSHGYNENNGYYN